MSSLIVIGGTTQGLEFGVDGFSWQLGARFGGIRGVQQGLHLVVFGAGQGVGRQGVWVCLGERDVAALKWDPSKEAVADGGARLALPEGAAVAARRAAAAPDAARHGLGSYPEGHAEVWKRLASHIDESTLERVGLSTNAAFGPGSSGDDEESNAVVDADLAVAKWTALEEPVRVEALRVGASLSAYHTDSSDKLRAVCALRFVDWRGAVAEHALAFVTFVALGSLQALKQWQRLTALLCTCDAMIAGAPEAVGFAPALAGNLEAQLSIFVDADFFRDPISSADDVVRPALKAFFETGSASDDAETRKAVASLEAFANKRFGDSLACDDDDAPAVVSADDVDAALQRLAVDGAPSPPPPPAMTRAADLPALGYAALAAVMLPDGQEDALMACMRILDDDSTDATTQRAKQEAHRFLVQEVGAGET